MAVVCVCVIRTPRVSLTHHNGTNHLMDVFKDVLILLLHEWQH